VIQLILTFAVGLFLGVAVKNRTLAYCVVVGSIAAVVIGWMLVIEGYLQLLFFIPSLPIGLTLGVTIRQVLELLRLRSEHKSGPNGA
jgi:uncharacterized membrane protein YjjB (DUF3815 family)